MVEEEMLFREFVESDYFTISSQSKELYCWLNNAIVRLAPSRVQGHGIRLRFAQKNSSRFFLIFNKILMCVLFIFFSGRSREKEFQGFERIK